MIRAIATSKSCGRTWAATLAGLCIAACTPLAPAGTADTGPAAANVAALAAAMARQPVVLLGEVHDNVAQHALRAQALQRLFASGARPALAFEQIDREKQSTVDRIRHDAAAPAQARADRIIAAAGAPGWNWPLYRPYLLLALQYEVPIVAANLSRAQAMRLATEGADAVFSADQRAALGLDAIAPDLEKAQEYEIAQGHCGGLPAESLPAMARAQIARDAVLAQSIGPYLRDGVVLLTGNGHARRDIGVPRHLPAADQARTIAIGLLEDDDKADSRSSFYDVALRTPVQERADPCAGFRHGPAPSMPPAGTSGTR